MNFEKILNALNVFFVLAFQLVAANQNEPNSEIELYNLMNDAYEEYRIEKHCTYSKLAPKVFFAILAVAQKSCSNKLPQIIRINNPTLQNPKGESWSKIKYTESLKGFVCRQSLRCLTPNCDLEGLCSSKYAQFLMCYEEDKVPNTFLYILNTETMQWRLLPEEYLTTAQEKAECELNPMKIVNDDTGYKIRFQRKIFCNHLEESTFYYSIDIRELLEKINFPEKKDLSKADAATQTESE